MKTDTTIRITRNQYRRFAEVTKSVGLALNLSSFKRMENCWGRYSPWALLVCCDVRKDEPEWQERALITLAASINTTHLRSCGSGRPELDWSVLEDHEIYPFVVWHEIGHRVDNFDCWLTGIKDVEIRDECHRRIRFVNELLADRYAWSQVRPGESVPMSENGKRLQERAAESLTYLEKHATKLSSPCRSLAAGQYLDVPEYMLDGHQRAAFIGPQVSRKLVQQRVEYHRKRIAEGRRPLY
ncbi:hypothetical protein H7683_22590 [Ectopseudomonas mendocina]|uniref:hypothetical protein n=1 Tax=Ectopseudomonas mendocina TaxID=300 RepID=UPI00117BABC3|nr:MULTISPECIES: hypothetical protein [Pseudomonas]MDF2073222.1 hypothetical protein [Pseudomonas mendocina]QTN45723.1 hypothetical protein H7683_22590 [Pseudomonas mendocina]TRO40916.1 hypothetical protein EQ832_04490 [Pseudomonas sp. ALS1131]